MQGDQWLLRRPFWACQEERRRMRGWRETAGQEGSKGAGVAVGVGAVIGAEEEVKKERM